MTNFHTRYQSNIILINKDISEDNHNKEPQGWRNTIQLQKLIIIPNKKEKEDLQGCKT